MSNGVAGFFRRFLAFLIDIIPIVIITAFVAYLVGFKDVLDMYLRDINNIEYRAVFLSWRNFIRDISFLVYCIYCCVLEATTLEGTLGKMVLKIKVIKKDGTKITLLDSIKRNLFKIVSYLPLSLGFIWALFNRKRFTWHDYFAKTIIIHRENKLISE